jgi:hypothetical protein
MMRATLSKALLALIVIVFGLAIAHLYQLRFSSGDIYPPYSSLRSDPLGTRALYDSLDSLPGMQVQRHVRSPRHWPRGHGTALLVLGLPPEELSGETDEVHELERFVQEGGRLVITLRSDGFRHTKGLPGSKTNVPPARLRLRPTPPIELSTRWGFQLSSVSPAQEEKDTPPTQVTRVPEGALPPELAWHSDGVFLSVTNPWHSVYVRGTNAVVIERRMGAGSIALATDSYPASNEALRNHRAPALLAWMVGDAGRVVFNETHLGISETPGFATLARRYRLQLFFLVLGVLAALFVWQSSASFVPPPSESAGEAPSVGGRDAAGGFASLLRRNILPSQVLPICLAEWTRSGHGGRRVSPERLQKVQAILDRENQKPASQHDPVAVYREIAQALRPAADPRPDSTHPASTATQPHS